MLLEGEFGGEILAEGAGGEVWGEFDEAAGGVAIVVPAGVVGDGIEADAEDGNPETLSLTDLGGDVAKPADGGGGFGAGFGDDDGAVVAGEEVGEHGVEGAMEGMAGRGTVALVDPLVVPVEVDAENVEDVCRAAELGGGMAGQHVPGLELGVGVPEGGGGVFGFGGVGDDADDGLGLDEAGGGIDGANSACGGNGSADELALQLGAAAGTEGVEVFDIAADPGPERDLVDGAIEGWVGEAGGLAAIPDEGGGGGGEGGEAGDELRREWVEIAVGIGGGAPMAEVPENLRAGGVSGVEHGEEAGPVVDAGDGFDEVPAETVTNGVDAGPGEELVVFGGAGVVVGRGDHVDAGAVAAAMGGAFEAAEEEALETRGRDDGRFCHRRERAPRPERKRAAKAGGSSRGEMQIVSWRLRPRPCRSSSRRSGCRRGLQGRRAGEAWRQPGRPRAWYRRKG